MEPNNSEVSGPPLPENAKLEIDPVAVDPVLAALPSSTMVAPDAVQSPPPPSAETPATPPASDSDVPLISDTPMVVNRPSLPPLTAPNAQTDVIPRMPELATLSTPAVVIPTSSYTLAQATEDPVVPPVAVAPVSAIAVLTNISSSSIPSLAPATEASATNVEPTTTNNNPTQQDIDEIQNELKVSLDAEQALILEQMSLLTERQVIKTAIDDAKTQTRLEKLTAQKAKLELLTQLMLT
jgi:hypothetical protein